MSDMSRPQPTTPAEHDQHDTLLVAQFAAHDPLDASQQRAAAALVASCSECASLASDLRAVSGAVAWEPVPPRRRDFRLSPEQAEAARGSRLQQFMRRLTLPEAKRLQPLAAGVMSLGLLLVATSVTWHHHWHGSADLRFGSQGRDRQEASRIGDGTVSTSRAADSCPICLSHRLLAQGQARAQTCVAAPPVTWARLVWPPILPAADQSLLPEARGPPSSPRL